MALIGTIRNNMWFVFLLIALATAAFILMDAQGPGGNAFTGQSAVGVIGGEKVTNMDFERAYQTLFTNSQDPFTSREALWNYFVEEKIIDKEAEGLGLHVGYDELMDLQFGQNISPIIYQNFLNPQTGQVDFVQLQSVKQTIESGGDLNPTFKQFWAEQEKQIIKTQKQVKLTSLVQKAMYTPNWMVETAFQEQNGTVDIAVVKIPFDNISGDDVTVSDADIKEFINENKDQFSLTEEKRVLEYVSIDVLPTAQDSATWTEEINSIISDFRDTENDSLFVANNEGLYRDYYQRAEEIDVFYLDKLDNFEVGGVYGPYELGRSYQTVKLVDKRIVADSVRAKHILKRVTPGNITQLEEAEALIDSLMLVARRGITPFDTLAAQFSEDLNNKDQGGDLGYFPQGMMVPEFNEVCFLQGSEGEYYKVKTQFGIHLVYIDDKIFNDRAYKYNLAYINVPIIPSRETQDAEYERMLDLVSSYPYLDDLREAIQSDPNFSIQTSPQLGINDFRIDGIGEGSTSRELVKWAFDPETQVDDVSPTVFTYTDNFLYFNSQYVIAALSRVVDPGLPSADDVRSSVEFAVLNRKKGEQVLSDISTSNLSEVASQYNVTVDTFRTLNLLNTFVAGLGNEPEVLGTAFGQDEGETSTAILGNSGVFLVQTLGKVPSGDITDIGFLKKSLSDRFKTSTPNLLMEALRKGVDIKDNRAVYY